MRKVSAKKEEIKGGVIKSISSKFGGRKQPGPMDRVDFGIVEHAEKKLNTEKQVVVTPRSDRVWILDVIAG